MQAMSLLDDVTVLEKLVAGACGSQHVYAWPWQWSSKRAQPDPEAAAVPSTLPAHAKQVQTWAMPATIAFCTPILQACIHI